MELYESKDLGWRNSFVLPQCPQSGHCHHKRHHLTTAVPVVTLQQQKSVAASATTLNSVCKPWQASHSEWKGVPKSLTKANFNAKKVIVNSQAHQPILYFCSPVISFEASAHSPTTACPALPGSRLHCFKTHCAISNARISLIRLIVW